MSIFIRFYNKDHEQTGYESTRTTSMKQVAKALIAERESNSSVVYAALQVDGKLTRITILPAERENIVIWIKGKKPHFK